MQSSRLFEADAGLLRTSEGYDGCLGDLAFEMEIETDFGTVGVVALHMEGGDPLPAVPLPFKELEEHYNFQRQWRAARQSQNSGARAPAKLAVELPSKTHVVFNHSQAASGNRAEDETPATRSQAAPGAVSPNSVVDSVVDPNAWGRAWSMSFEDFDYCKDNLKAADNSKVTTAGCTPYDAFMVGSS